MATNAQLSQKKSDIQMMMIASEVHLGTKKCNYQMERYVYKRRNDVTVHFVVVTLLSEFSRFRCQTLYTSARVIVAIENPQDIIVQSARHYGQRAVLKFAQYTGANAIAGRHTPGTFTNQMQTSFSEPRLLILSSLLRFLMLRGREKLSSQSVRLLQLVRGMMQSAADAWDTAVPPPAAVPAAGWD
ncbi:40S ribosomal protein Sa-1 [Raphanus sativus]|nr:40S ribosomal protein Sa-1 [Raphanus sativus]